MCFFYFRVVNGSDLELCPDCFFSDHVQLIDTDTTLLNKMEVDLQVSNQKVVGV